MSEEIDELLEAEYVAQQEAAPPIQPVEVKEENEKKPEPEIPALLVDISETLRLLSEQMIRLNEVTKTLPEIVSALKTTTEEVEHIARELPTIVREQCLEEYKKILGNAVRNYNQMQTASDKWQKSMDEKREKKFTIITISEFLTPGLLLLSLLLK